jgi:hypothetical protein
MRSNVSTRPSSLSPHTWILPLLIAIYCVLAGLLIFRVPLGQAPDEGAHMEYVRYLIEHRELPFFDRRVPKTDDPVLRGGNGPGFEFHQPPLYYIVSAIASAPFFGEAQFYASRFVSLICGALCLLLLWRGVRALWPESPQLAILATGFAALWPLHINIGAMANNDAMAGLFAAWVFERIAQIASRGWKNSDALWLGLASGLGLSSKSTGLVLMIVVVGAAFVFARSRVLESDEKPSILSPLGVLVVALVVCAPWMIRNQNLYGDALALGAVSERFQFIGSRVQNFAGLETGIYPRALVLILFSTFWGVFGGPNTALQMLNPFGRRAGQIAQQSALTQTVTPLLMAICALMMVFAVWGCVRSLHYWKEAPTGRRTAVLFWLLGALFVFAAWAQFNTIQFQAQARYLHPALLPITLIFARGWMEIFSGRALKIVTGIFAVTLLLITLWNAFGWRTLV